MRASTHHKQLSNGVGKCSVPMWSRGVPAGFCDRPAFGQQEPGQNRYGQYINGRWADGYCSGLACHAHGGPEAPYIDVVFEGPPSHESGRFVEVENSIGASERYGEWINRRDGYWALRIPRATAPEAT